MDWLKERVSERTSWDGAVLIVVCGLVLFTGGLAKILAVAGLAYGAWTCWKGEEMPYHTKPKKGKKKKRTGGKKKKRGMKQHGC